MIEQGELNLTLKTMLDGIACMKSLGLFQSILFDYQKNEQSQIYINGLIPSICPARIFLPETLSAFIQTNFTEK